MTHIFSSKSDSTIANVCLSVCHRNPSESSLSVITCICHLSSIMHFPYQPSYPSLSKSWISAIMPISLHANPSLWPNMCLSAIWSEFATFEPFRLFLFQSCEYFTYCHVLTVLFWWNICHLKSHDNWKSRYNAFWDSMFLFSFCWKIE